MAVGGVGLHLGYQVFSLDLDDVADCWAKFVSNTKVGLFLFLGIVAGRLLDEEEEKLGDREREAEVDPRGVAAT